jgi:hypothetical protein
MNIHFQVNSNDIIIILLSIAFPFVLNWIEELNRKINNFMNSLRFFLNTIELDKSENYYKQLSLLTDQKENIKFLTEIEISDDNPILKPGRSSQENSHLRYWQKELKKSYKTRGILNIVKYIIPLIVIIILLFSS